MVAVSAIVDRGGNVLRAGVRSAVRIAGWTAAGTATARAVGRRQQSGDVGTGVFPPPERASYVEAQAAGLAPVSMAYERHGTGEPVVLLHGLGLSRRSWDAVVPLLAGDREVIMIDLPGFGQSPDWPADVPRDVPTTATVLDAAFTALGLRRPHVVGHSLGGLIALRLGQADLVRSVTALAPAGFWNEAERRYAFAVLAAARRIAQRVPDTATEWLSETTAGRTILAGMLYGDPAHCPPGAVVAYLHAVRDAVGFEATLRAGRTPGLFNGQITGIPVTIAWGTDDRILPRRQARRALAMLPQAQLISLPRCGHVPMNDAPELVARVILRATDPSAAGPPAGLGEAPADEPGGDGHRPSGAAPGPDDLDAGGLS
jgi:pimeloyl-ACP methyl ester carboxylesterase